MSIVEDAVCGLLLEAFEQASDLHDWLASNPYADRPFYFELGRWHRTVGKVSWRLELYERPRGATLEAHWNGAQASILVDPADPLFPEQAISWLREQRAALEVKAA